MAKVPRKPNPFLGIKQDNLVSIFPYTGEDRPKIWDKETYNQIGCQPTNHRYRVLRTSGCPIEARIRESANSDNPDHNSACCTSRVGQASHPPSLQFLRDLKSIYQNTAPYLTDQQKMGMLPPKLRRVMYWINSPTNVSDIDPVDLTAPIQILTDNERFEDLVKFSLMIESGAEIWGSHPNNPFMYGFKYTNRMAGTKIAVEIDFELFQNIVRVTNPYPKHVATGTVQLIRVPPVRVSSLQVRSANPFALGARDPTCVVFSDITNHFRIQRGGNFVQGDQNGFAVIESSTTTRDEIASMFDTLRETPRDLHATFILHNGNDDIPAGYTSLNFQNDSILGVATVIYNSLQGQKRRFTQINADWVSFEYLQTLGTWFKLELFKRVDTVERFDYWINQQMP